MIESDQLIDLCTAYIEDKDCHYLAKEGQIVRYFSITGRKSDFAWHKATIAETLRIIKAMRCSADEATELREHHLIAAFQELGKVYEFAVKTRHTTLEGVFNYSEHAEMSLGDEAMSLLVDSMLSQGFTAILMRDVVELYDAINAKLKLALSPTECRELMFKHFEASGYTVKTGAHRPLIDGKKQPAIMQGGTKPSQVVSIPNLVANKVVAKIYGELI